MLHIRKSLILIFLLLLNFLSWFDLNLMYLSHTAPGFLTGVERGGGGGGALQNLMGEGLKSIHGGA